MADIDNQEAIAFAGQLRQAADQLAALYLNAKRLMNIWHARNYGVILPVDAEATVLDGRIPEISGNDAVGIIVQLEGLINDMEANNKGKLNVVLKVAPNP